VRALLEKLKSGKKEKDKKRRKRKEKLKKKTRIKSSMFWNIWN
jgi:hypothetical protein